MLRKQNMTAKKEKKKSFMLVNLVALVIVVCSTRSTISTAQIMGGQADALWENKYCMVLVK